MQHNTAIGIMDEAYFVPRQEILHWINRCLKLQVNVVQDLGTGAVYCQLLDAAFGQRVSMQKVNWKAKFQYEFISNLKVFQTALQKLGITKKIDIEKLAKTRYQDNLELIQWLKRYIEISGNINEDYPAEQRRNHAQLYAVTQTKKALGTSFKTNASFLNTYNANLNQSICSTTSKTKQITPRARVISNKQNHFNENSKKYLPNAKILAEQMNQIRKILTGNDDSDSKISDINKIVYGNTSTSNSQCPKASNLMDIEAVQSDEEMVF